MGLSKQIDVEEVANSDELREFTMAIENLGGKASYSNIFIKEILGLDKETIEAANQLAKSDELEFDEEDEILKPGFRNYAQNYQDTIRVLKDNSWIITKTSETGKRKFVLAEKAYEELEWL
jgi:hypothetical protein